VNSEERDVGGRPLTSTLAVRVDAACDRFEAGWRAGRRPGIESHLDGISGPEREALLRELLVIEVVWRRRLGERPAADEYRARFPDDAGAIDDALEEAEWPGPDRGPGAAPDGDDRPDPAAGPARDAGPRFRLLRPHAGGGLGMVFVAEDTDLHREVALKEIRGPYARDPDSRARFVFEAEVTGGLEHPGVVPVYGLGTYTDGSPYYAMRFIRGDSLKDAVARFHAAEGPARDVGERALAFRELLRRFVDVCNTIAYAHSRGVLHRDLKPGNIMLGPYGETLVVDWGLAKVFGQPEPGLGPAEAMLRPPSGSGLTPTVRGATIGTPAYMSPEQAAGRIDHLSPASDVYSLGAVLYHLLTGRAPFEGPVEQVLGAVRGGQMRPPRAVNPAIDAALEAVCLKAMAHDPAARYASPRALADDVERWSAGEPVMAWPEPFVRRARRWARRHRTAVTAAAAAALAGLIATAAVQARANARLRDAFETTSRALADTAAAKKAADAALTQSERSRRESDESRAQAEAVATFLIETFRSPDPALRGPEVKVAAVLDRAVDQLEAGFAGSPATKGLLLHVLGQTYQGLGLYEKAIAIYSKTYALREAALGPDHPDTHFTRNNWATALKDAGRTAEAIRMHEELLGRRESRWGPDHPDTLVSRSNLAAAYHDAGRVKEAIALQETTLRQREAVLGPDHPDTLNIRNNLAAAYEDAGRVEKAIDLHEANLKIMEAQLGPDHPETLSSRNNLAEAYSNAGRAAKAIALHEANLKLHEVRHGPDHPRTLIGRNNLAAAYRDAGRTAEAIAMHEGTVRIMEAKLAPEHPGRLAASNNLARAYLDAGRITEAIARLEATLKLMEANLGADHKGTLAGSRNLASAYEPLGRWAEAEALRRRILDSRRRTASPDSPDLADDLALLARNLTGQTRWAEAEPILRESLAIRTKVNPDDWTRHNVMSQLGGALLALGRHAEAEPLVIRGYEGLKARAGAIPLPSGPRLSEAAARVVRLYESWGKPEEAARWKTKLGLADLPAEVFASP
jgi:tetratricopeptide (TPR) repeat protein